MGWCFCIGILFLVIPTPFSLRRFIAYLIVQFFTFTLQAQEYYNFIHYPAESGINSYQVNTTVQDSLGYLWLGTTNGLQRFDGVRFKTFRHDSKNPLSIPLNPVWQLLVDKNKNLWVLLSDGRVGIFDTHNFTFREAAVKFKYPVSPNTMLKKLVTDEDGNIFYIISGSEVITFNKNANEFSYDYNFFTTKGNWKIIDFVQQPGTKKYWFSLEKGGIAIYNFETGVMSDGIDNAGKEPAVNVFDKAKTYYNLFFDSKNRLWTVNHNGQATINCYSFLIDEFTVSNMSLYPEVKSKFEIKNFMQQKDGTIWLYGLFLLSRFSEGEGRFQLVHNGYESEHSISYEMVHTVCEDRENNLWVCTDNNGLYRFNPSMEFFINIDHNNRITREKGNGNILSFLRTRWGSLLVGTTTDGLYEYDKTFNLIPSTIKGIDGKSGPAIWSMANSKDSSKLWMGTDGGFYEVDQLQRSSRLLRPATFEGNTVRQIVEDKNGNLWLGTRSKGVFKYAIDKKKNNSSIDIVAIDAVPQVQVNKITIGSNGFIWIGTPEDGLFVIDPQTGKLVMHFGENETGEKQLPERGISSVLQYSDSVIVISTATRLVKYNVITHTTKVIADPGIMSGFITAMEKDGKGYLWLTTTNGLYRIDIYKGIFILYDRTDGLDNEHFIQSSSYVLPDGKMLFGATHNFVLFNPNRMKRLPFNPLPKITGIKIGGKWVNADSLLAQKELVLDYDDGPLLIEYAPFTFSSMSILKYKMAGLDKDWNTSDKTYQAVYNYLPSGTYDFMIKQPEDMSNNSDGVFMLQITVKSPYWKTWWFYSLLVLFIIAIFYRLDRQRMKRKEVLQNMRSGLADDLHEEINTALNNINILSEMARIKADTEPEKSKDFIEQIHTKSHNMIIAMDDMLWSISPENDSMEKTILRLREFIEALKNRHAVQIDLLVDQNVNLLQLNMKQRKDVFWFFKGGIANVVRSGGKNCFIHITLEKSNLIYTLEFDNTSLNVQQMNNLRQRKELADKLANAHAKLEAKDLKTKTIFQVTIPVTK
ncbi:MAG: two-component regulator propeller domain-containing protein [Chitinophagaceae bacterium]